jgi:hypothetical protein
VLEVKFPAGHARVVKAYERLATLYDRMGNAAAAAEARAKLPQAAEPPSPRP